MAISSGAIRTLRFKVPQRTTSCSLGSPQPISLVYAEVKVDCGYRADLVVEKKVIIEAKSVEALNEIHLMQTLTHLKLLDFSVGLLINFNVVPLMSVFKRVVNRFQEA